MAPKGKHCPVPSKGVARQPLRATYTLSSLHECARLVNEEGKTGAEARAHILGLNGEVIPKGTLAGYTNGKKQADGTRTIYTAESKHGAPTYLDSDDEQRLYNLVVECAELGCPISDDDIASSAWHLDLTRAALEKNEPRFGENGPSPEWTLRYTNTWKLSERITMDKEPKRTNALTANVIADTFRKWESARSTGYKGEAFPLKRQYNMDEFGKQSRVGKQRKGVFPRGWKDACSRMGAGDRNSFTGISCNNAAGEELELTWIFKGEWRATDRQRAIVKACHGWSRVSFQPDSHMMTMTHFMGWIDWFAAHPDVQASPDNPALLALDGHASRMSLFVWKYALSKGVHMFVFPGGITSHIQPQDVGILGPFTSELGKAYSRFSGKG